MSYDELKKDINVTIKIIWQSIWNKQNTKLKENKKETNRWLKPNGKFKS